MRGRGRRGLITMRSCGVQYHRHCLITHLPPGPSRARSECAVGQREDSPDRRVTLRSLSQGESISSTCDDDRRAVGVRQQARTSAPAGHGGAGREEGRRGRLNLVRLQLSPLVLPLTDTQAAPWPAREEVPVGSGRPQAVVRMAAHWCTRGLTRGAGSSQKCKKSCAVCLESAQRL